MNSLVRTLMALKHIDFVAVFVYQIVSLQPAPNRCLVVALIAFKRFDGVRTLVSTQVRPQKPLIPSLKVTLVAFKPNGLFKLAMNE